MTAKLRTDRNVFAALRGAYGDHLRTMSQDGVSATATSLFSGDSKFLGGCPDFIREARHRGWVEKGEDRRWRISKHGRVILAAYEVWVKQK